MEASEKSAGGPENTAEPHPEHGEGGNENQVHQSNKALPYIKGVMSPDHESGVPPVGGVIMLLRRRRRKKGMKERGLISQDVGGSPETEHLRGRGRPRPTLSACNWT